MEICFCRGHRPGREMKISYKDCISKWLKTRQEDAFFDLVDGGNEAWIALKMQYESSASDVEKEGLLFIIKEIRLPEVTLWLQNSLSSKDGKLWEVLLESLAYNGGEKSISILENLIKKDELRAFSLGQKTAIEKMIVDINSGNQ